MQSRSFSNSQIHSHLRPYNIQAIQNLDVEGCFEHLFKIGIGLDEKTVEKMMATMDAIQSTVTTGSMDVPLQFLQAWLPGFVNIITAARKIDDLVGMDVVGSWEDEEYVQQVMELTGSAVPYGDYTNVPFSSWNNNFERRTFVRFEEGMRVGQLEAARAARLRVDTAGQKRAAAALALEIVRNYTGFYGYNSGANRTYGFLNDPNLPAYVNVPNGAAGTPTWATKTFLEIAKDIRLAIISLRTNSKDQIDPEKTPLTLAVATAAVDNLSTTSDFGISVRNWLKEAYPNIRVISAPELDAANGGANVFYLYADQVNDSYSTDDRRVFMQSVASKFQVLGIKQDAKFYVEDYTNSVGGILLKRPYAVVRRSGI